MKNVVIAGGGDVGYALAKTLSDEGHNITVIEKDGVVAAKLDSLDVLVIQGNAASSSVLNKAYISSSDYFIAVTASDEVNMAACAIAKNRGCRTVARINNDEYIQNPISDEDLKDCGVDIAFCPELISATHMANILTIPTLLDSPLLGEGMVKVLESRVGKGSSAIGKEIRKVGFPRDVNLVAIFRNEGVLIPQGSTRLEMNDRVVALMPNDTGPKVMATISKLLGVYTDINVGISIEKVMIAGGSRVGQHLARILQDRDLSVILIEEDERRCVSLSEKLQKVLVIHGSPTDKELLKEEGISETDTFMAVTEKEEVNILASLMAGQYGSKRSIALVDRPDLKSVLEEIGVDLVVSPRSVTLSTILKHFHRDEFESLATLNQGEAHVVQVKVKEKSKIANKRIRKITGFRKRNLLVGAIIRGKRTIIPRGDTVIKPSDRLVIFTKSSTLKMVKDLVK